MINWTLLQPRNLFVVAALVLLSYFVFQHFSKKLGAN